MPLWVRPSSPPRSNRRARPMSTSLARPCGVTMMFDGLISRWTTPRSAACTRASAIWSVKLTASPTGSGPFFSTRCRTVVPSMYSNAMIMITARRGRSCKRARCSRGRAGPRRGLPGKTAARPRIVCACSGGRIFKRDVPIKPRIERPEDRSHAADADEALQLEDVDGFAGARQGGGSRQRVGRRTHDDVHPPRRRPRRSDSRARRRRAAPSRHPPQPTTVSRSSHAPIVARRRARAEVAEPGPA